MPATRGTVRLLGRRVTRGDARIGMMLQHHGLFPWYTAEKNVTLGYEIRERNKAAEHTRQRTGTRGGRSAGVDRARKVLERLGLGGLEHRYPRELSGGELQRVALARTIVSDPQVLLFDEPFSALDALTREELQDLLAAYLSDTGIPTVLVTHSIEEAVYLGHQVGILSRRESTGRLDIVPNPFAPSHLTESPGDRRTDPRYLAACAEIRRMFGEYASA